MSRLRVVVGIALLKNIKKLRSGEIDALPTRVVSHVIHHRRGWRTAHYLAGVGIQNDQLAGVASADEHPLPVLIKGYRRWFLSFFRNQPGCQESSLCSVKNLYRIVSPDDDEHPRT